jgi:hypothetical protein
MIRTVTLTRTLAHQGRGHYALNHALNSALNLALHLSLHLHLRLNLNQCRGAVTAPGAGVAASGHGMPCPYLRVAAHVAPGDAPSTHLEIAASLSLLAIHHAGQPAPLEMKPDFCPR